jgi:hypothetical protein
MIETLLAVGNRWIALTLGGYADFSQGFREPSLGHAKILDLSNYLLAQALV